MKTLQATDLQVTNRQFKIDAVIRQIETIFQAMQFPDVEGIQIYQLLSDNLHYEGDGVYAVKVNQLQGEVEFLGSPHSVWLRNHNGVLQYSNDHSTWAAVGSGGAGGGGDMLKDTYDPQDTGRVLAAGKLADATHEITALQMATHLADNTIHFEQSEIDYGNLQNTPSMPTHTPAEIDAFIDAGGTLPAVLELPSQATDPATPATLSLLFYAKEYQQGPMHWMQPTLKSNGGDVVTIATMDEQSGRMLSDHLPEDVMYAGTYINNDTPANATAVTKANHVANDGFLLSGNLLLDLAKGLKSIGVDGNSAYYVADGVAIMMQNPEPAASAHAAIVYLWMESPDPVVYALRVVFPDGTRRRMVTEAIV